MVTTVIDKQPVLTNKVIEILLKHYNEGLEEPVILVETATTGCWSTCLEYTFFRAVGDMPNHYEEGKKLSESDTLLHLAHSLNERKK